MKLLIDMQALQSPNTRDRGIDRYVRGLTTGLAAARPSWQLECVQNNHLPLIDSRGMPMIRMTTYEPPFGKSPTDVAANELHFADWIGSRAPDAVLIGSCFDEQVLVPRFIGRGLATFAILYDLIPLLFHEEMLTQPRSVESYGERLRRMLSMDGVLAISESSAADLRSVATEKCPPTTCISGAPDDRFVSVAVNELQPWRETLRNRFGLERGFVLYVGGFDFRKNLRGAIEAFANLPESARRQLDFVIACRLVPAHRRQIEEWGREFNIADSLRLTGFVSDEELQALYCLCRVFFFPSLYEGLGLPVLEAMQCGAPVVASNRSSIPEVAGAGAWLADPDSPADMARALVEALEEPRDARRSERLAHARQFTWATTAEIAATAMSRGGEVRVHERFTHSPKRRRVAWVSPLPPTMSGIADYTVDLITPLADHFDIELVIDSAETSVDSKLGGKFPVLAASELPARHMAHPFDQFVYHVGNSHHHIYMLDLIRRYRGLVMLHDYFLGGLVLPATLAGAWPVSLADELEFEGEKKFAAQLQAGTIGAHEIIDLAPLNRRILSHAGGLIVHTAWSWERVRRLVSVPVTRIAHAVDVPPLKSREIERHQLGLPARSFIVATLGFVGPPKRIPSLLQAVAELPGAVRARTLVLIVGYAPPSEEQALRQLTDGLSLSSQVRLLGRVTLDEFVSYARASDVCVQLRYPTRGESSGALLRELAAGAACIVSDHGSIAEFPDDVACKVRTLTHEVSDLRAALLRLYHEPAERDRLSAAAREHFEMHHTLAHAVEQYAAIIELSAAQRTAEDRRWVESTCDALADCSDPTGAARHVPSWILTRQQARRRNTQPRHLQTEAPPFVDSYA